MDLMNILSDTPISFFINPDDSVNQFSNIISCEIKSLT